MPHLTRTKKKTLKVKCKCGETYEIEVEFRNNYRKQVDLYGTCSIKTSMLKHESHDIKIKDLSREGSCIEFIMDRAKNAKCLNPGDTVTIDFKLDNSHENIITKRCKIKNIRENSVGLQFIDNNFDRQLGFYLM